MLKEREQKILDYMREEIRKKGYPPTVREICSALNIKSTSTAHKDISNLVKAGYIKKDPSKPRALMLVEADTSGQTTYETGNDRSHRHPRRRQDSGRNTYPGGAEHRRQLPCSRPFCREQSQHHADCERRKHD